MAVACPRGREVPRVGIVGDFFVDIQAKVATLPRWDTDVETPAIEVFAGGSAGNTARQLAVLGPEVLFFSTCGDDTLGTAALSQLHAEQFNTTHLKRLPGVASSSCIVLSGPADRSFISCYSSVNALSAELIDADALRSCDHVHVGGYLGLRGLQTEAFTSLVRSCRERGATVSLGTNCDPNAQWTGEGKELHKLLPHVDIFLSNESERAEIEKALAQPLTVFAPGLVVVETRGSAGVLVHALGESGEDAQLIPAQFVKEPEDLTGAGDAFTAGFLSRWVFKNKRNVVDAAAWGNACAACNIKRRGGCSEPVPREEVVRMREFGMSAA